MTSRVGAYRPELKICGVTQVDDARWLAELPIQSVGLNFYPGSPRCVSVQQAARIAEILPDEIEVVGVFVDMPTSQVAEIAREVGLDRIQLHGSETVADAEALADWPVMKAWRWTGKTVREEIERFIQEVRVRPLPSPRLLLDAYRPNEAGGTGHAWDWTDMANWRPTIPWLLAGGISPANVREAVDTLHPTGVDVASGAESAPGIKDRSRVEALLREIGTT